MIDIIKEAMNLLLADRQLMNLLGDNCGAISRMRSPYADILPRVELALIDDADGDFFDNRPTSYIADIRVMIYKRDSRLFEISDRVNEIFRGKSFSRERNSDSYSYDLELYAKEMIFRCKILIEGDGFQWVRL